MGQFIEFIKGLFSESDGSPSSTRVLMFLFSMFSCWIIWRILYHVFRISDPTQISIWLANLPMLIGALVALIALPYTVNKGTNTLSDVANMFATIKTNGNQVSNAVNTAVNNPTVQAVAAKIVQKTGSPGVVKG